MKDTVTDHNNQMLLKASRGRRRTKPLTHRQVGVYDILFAQQEDVSHVDVVGWNIHAEELLLP